MNSIFENPLFHIFSTAADNMYVYVTDISSNKTRWSTNAVKYFNLDDEYMFDTKSKWLEYIHPDDRNDYIDDISKVFLGKKECHDIQYRVLNRYGEYVWVECKGSVLKDENGNITVFAGIMTRIDNQTKYDNLTKLMTFYEFQKIGFSQNSGSIMLLGIDGFRKINNQYGVLYGNKVLAYLASVIEDNAPNNCKVYHYQGDEFLVYSTDCSVTCFQNLFVKLRDICLESNADNDIRGFSISAGAVSIQNPNDTPMNIVTKAVNANSFAKETLEHFVCYTEEIEKKQNRKNLVSELLTESIYNDFKDFELYFQPVMDGDGKKVYGCESLLRWNPNNDLIGNCYPSEFIPILEKNGLIIPVGTFVMIEAIKQASEWHKQGKRIRVSLNVSYLQFEDPEFTSKIIETAKKYAVDTSLITIELTESVFTADTVMIQREFTKLHAEGFHIALDDFGTGHSSFWVLHNLEVDVIKLDQTFIRELGKKENKVDMAIVESVSVLCKNMKYRTVVEGVEDETVLSIINQYHFNGLQGYHFSKPIPKKEFEQFLEKYL